MFYDPNSMKYNTFPQHCYAEMGETCTQAVPSSPIIFIYFKTLKVIIVFSVFTYLK